VPSDETNNGNEANPGPPTVYGDLCNLVIELSIVDCENCPRQPHRRPLASLPILTQYPATTQPPHAGSAQRYVAGFAAARGDYIVMADADLTYDFAEIPHFVKELDEGAELVMGDLMDSHPRGGDAVGVAADAPVDFREGDR
jgi:hypothetical protein